MDTAVTALASLESLTGSAAPSLGAWYGDPLPEAAARTLLAAARERLRAAHGRGRPCFACRLQEMAARYWLGRDVEGDYRTLMATAPGDRELALVDLVYGQLLMARKRPAARTHLDAGFGRATHLLAPRDYFEVLRRHELLRGIPLGERQAAAEPLQALLLEAAVIRRLEATGPPRPRPAGDGTDTLG